MTLLAVLAVFFALAVAGVLLVAALVVAGEAYQGRTLDASLLSIRAARLLCEGLDGCVEG